MVELSIAPPQRGTQGVAQRERRSSRRASGEGVVLPHILPPREGLLCVHLRLPARLVSVVHDREYGQMDDFPAGLLDAVAEICLLRIDEEAFVEEPALSSASRLVNMNDPDVQSHLASVS